MTRLGTPALAGDRNKQRLTDFTFTVQDPANCTVTKDTNGILTFTNVKTDAVLTITGPGSSSEFVIITKKSQPRRRQKRCGGELFVVHREERRF